PQAAWDAATRSNAGEPLQVTLVLGQGSNAFGPYTEAWTIAPATLQGAIYYNSYGTSLVKNSGTDGLDHYGNQYGAATLSIAARATAPTLVAGVTSANPKGDGTGCRVCHTVAMDGKSLVTQASNISASDYTDTVRIDLTNDTTRGAGTPLATASLAFPALSPNGSLLFSSAGGMIDGDSTSRLLALPSGTPVRGVTGVPSGLQAALPTFSPDGKHVAFNTWSGSFGGASKADRISLGVLDFDGTSTFSNPRVVYTPPPRGSAQPAVTFSSFLPTGTGVVFDLELSNPSGEWGFTRNGNTSELWWVDVATQQAHRLDRLNGNDASGNPALPDNASGAATHTAAQDVTLNYEPTVCPIGAGGYAWVVFTSRRMYGTVAQLGPWVSDPRKYPWLDQVTDKKLWVAAIDLNAPPGTDPSHPAFYLPAQELHAGNSRGFWSFASCKADQQNCETGAECCGGYCEMGDGGLACTSSPPACAAVYERCARDSDCCGAQGNASGVACINAVCTQSQPTR
ncbi:MAG TPA: dickkopf-related protein, partial [Polyangiaceae bacterium]|nr:dickkopf-related protein [Polyangiaceae bacterium]